LWLCDASAASLYISVSALSCSANSDSLVACRLRSASLRSMLSPRNATREVRWSPKPGMWRSLPVSFAKDPVLENSTEPDVEFRFRTSLVRLSVEGYIPHDLCLSGHNCSVLLPLLALFFTFAKVNNVKAGHGRRNRVDSQLPRKVAMKMAGTNESPNRTRRRMHRRLCWRVISVPRG
jgi:hypothetical protein